MLTFAFTMLLTLAPQQAPSPVACAELKLDPETEIATGTGGCILNHEDMHFESDWLVWDRSNGNVVAGDHVHFTRGTEQIDGSHLHFNLMTKAGTIQDATGKVEPGFHLVAEVAERFTDESWEFHNTRITACEAPEPCWTIVWGRAWYRQGKWIRGRNAVFHFHGIPVIPLPYVVAPSEQKPRSTGFLIPSISNSSIKGLALKEEFYYVINDSADVSVIGEYFTKRGPTGEVNFRAKPTSTGWMSVNWFGARDKENQGGHSLRVLSYTNWGQYSRAVVDLETESSLTFRQVWGASFNVIASPINRSIGYFTRNSPNSSLNFLYARSEFLHSDPSTTLRKFPSVEFSLPSREIHPNLPVYFRLDSSVSGIARRDAVMTTSEFGGRFDFHPSVEMPILRMNAFELSHEIGVRDTGYYHSLDPALLKDALNRFTIDYSARFSGPQFEKSYGKWRHSIQPTLDYRYVTGVDRFRDNIIVDEVDLVANTSELEYGITNRILGSRELLQWRVAQTRYFNPTFGGAIRPDLRNVFTPLMGLTGFSFAEGPRDFSPIVSKLRLTPTPSNAIEVQVDFDTQLHRVRNTGVIASLQKKKWATTILYAFTHPTGLQAPNHQVHGTLSYGTVTGRGFNFSTTAAYDVQHRLFQGSTTQLGYNTECYGFNVEFTQYNLENRQEHKLRFAFALKNIGSFGTLRRPDRIF
ncbi:MAG TPA: LPS assembly protein LptD [Terriglobia bacterium]|nr:LPS assembly protein LptD [Terriglobia bacterium]